MIEKRPSVSPRVVMLVQNNVEFDSRVRKEAESLAAGGLDVCVVGTTAAHLPGTEEVRGVVYRRVSVERNLPWLYRWPRRLASLRSSVAARTSRRCSIFRLRIRSSIFGLGIVSRMTRMTESASRLYFERRARLLAELGFGEAHVDLGEPRLRASLMRRPILLARVTLAWSLHGLVTSLRSLTRRHWRRAKRLVRMGGKRRSVLLRRMRRTVLPWRARRTVLLRRIRRSFAIKSAKLVAPVSLYVDYAVAVRHVVDEIVPDVVHAHDLNTLPAGVVAARRNGAKLIYDSHELELHRNQAWSRWKRFLARSFEFIGMRRADGVVTVSPLIAQHLARTYRVRRPTVLLNSPPLLTRSLEPAIDLRACAGLTHTDRLVVYVGTIGYRRGLDKLIQALALMPADFHVGFLGPRQPVRERPLLELGKQLGVETRMHFFGPVPAEQVPATLSGANGAVNPAPNVCLSYDLALPNKLFDAVMAGIPIGVGQLRHLSEFVIEHDVGVVFDEEDPSSIASALYQMNERWLAGLVDSDGLDELQTSVAWEVQEAQLYALYAALGLAPSRRTTAIVEPIR